MTTYCFSSTRNTITHSNLLFLNSNLYLPKYRNHVAFTQETKKDLILNIPKSSFSFSNPKNNKFSPPFASLSESTSSDENQENVQENDEELPGMASAFHISSNTASTISICIAIAALTLPIFMKSLAQGMGLKIKLLSYATLLFGFYMAWNIGANDVANAMGTSVGSGALTLRQAVLTAAVLEFSGALLMGRHVTSTMQKGILVANVFQGKDSLLFAGLLSSLAAAGTWLQVKLHLFASFRVPLTI